MLIIGVQRVLMNLRCFPLIQHGNLLPYKSFGCLFFSFQMGMYNSPLPNAHLHGFARSDLIYDNPHTGILSNRPSHVWLLALWYLHRSNSEHSCSSGYGTRHKNGVVGARWCRLLPCLLARRLLQTTPVAWSIFCGPVSCLYWPVVRLKISNKILLKKMCIILIFNFFSRK